MAEDGFAKQRRRVSMNLFFILTGRANTTYTCAQNPHHLLELEMRQHTRLSWRNTFSVLHKV